jgi:hypothetical protein
MQFKRQEGQTTAKQDSQNPSACLSCFWHLFEETKSPC